MEQMAAYVSLFGVVLIARPVSLFAFLSHSNEPGHVPPASGDLDIVVPANATADAHRLATEFDDVTPAQRASAVGVALLGVLGAAGAYTTIRWIGKRAHPLISVNYFATWCTIVSIFMMLALPGVGFLLPRSIKDWCYLTFLGVCGFVMASNPRIHLCLLADKNTAISPRCWLAVREVLTRNEHGVRSDAVRPHFRQAYLGHHAGDAIHHRLIADPRLGNLCRYAQGGPKEGRGRERKG